MKKQVILALLTVLIVGLIGACSKKSDPVPDSPVVGQWDLNRYIISDLPTSYSASNGTYTYDATKSGTDSYTFKNDGTFVYTYATSSNTNSTINGTWTLVGTVLTTTYTTSSGSTADVFTYNATASEISSNKYASSTKLTNPTTNVQETVTFGEVDVYKKKT